MARRVRDPIRRPHLQPLSLNRLLPNILTTLALCAGLTSVRFAVQGQWRWAVAAVLVAAVLDGLDGRIARLLRGSSTFGAQLDSLADFVSFGVAPALVLYSFVLHHLRALGWIVALVFAIAAALRLARFNVMIDDPNRPEWQKNFFVGMAAPAGAICSLLPIYLHFLGVPVGATAAPVALVYVLGIAFMMVSTIPTYSGKTMGARVPREWVLPIFVLTVAFFGLFVSFLFEVLALGTLVFLGTVPISMARYRQLARAGSQPAGPESGTPEADLPPTV